MGSLKGAWLISHLSIVVSCCIYGNYPLVMSLGKQLGSPHGACAGAPIESTSSFVPKGPESTLLSQCETSQGTVLRGALGSWVQMEQQWNFGLPGPRKRKSSFASAWSITAANFEKLNGYVCFCCPQLECAALGLKVWLLWSIFILNAYDSAT